MKKIILAYSGGLDTSYCLKKLSSEGHEVHAININTGGFSKNELKTMEDKAYMMGAFIFKSIDAVDIYYNKIIKYLIFGNVLRNNTYPLSVSSERVIQAVEIVKYAKKIMQHILLMEALEQVMIKLDLIQFFKSWPQKLKY